MSQTPGQATLSPHRRFARALSLTDVKSRDMFSGTVDLPRVSVPPRMPCHLGKRLCETILNGEDKPNASNLFRPSH